jgi:hypothetical protein
MAINPLNNSNQIILPGTSQENQDIDLDRMMEEALEDIHDNDGKTEQKNTITSPEEKQDPNFERMLLEISELLKVDKAEQNTISTSVSSLRSAPPTPNQSHLPLEKELEKETFKKGIQNQLLMQIAMYKFAPEMFRHIIGFSTNGLIIPNISIGGSDPQDIKILLDRLAPEDHEAIMKLSAQLKLDPSSLKELNLEDQAAFEKLGKLKLDSSKSEELDKDYLSLIEKLINEKKAIYVSSETSTSPNSEEISERLSLLRLLGIDPEFSQMMVEHQEFTLEATMGCFHTLSKNEDIIPLLIEKITEPVLANSEAQQMDLSSLYNQIKNIFPVDKFAVLQACYVSYLLENLAISKMDVK